MLILCTNDDGYLARGLGVLSEAARPLGEVHVVAPDREQSATSHSLTMHVPIRTRSVGERTHSVTGTPTAELAEHLAAVATGEATPGSATGRVSAGARPRRTRRT